MKNKLEASPSKKGVTLYSLGISEALLEYLLGGKDSCGKLAKKDSRFSRHAAFFDLIKRQRAAITVHGDEYIGCCVSELAEAWGWYRQTVSSFLTDLANLGAVSLKTANRRTIVKVNNFSFISGKNSPVGGRASSAPARVIETPDLFGSET